MDMLKKLLFLSVFTCVLTTTSYADSNKLSPAETKSLATIAAIDTDEILLAILAANKKTSSGVQDFAKMMIDMHGSNLSQIFEMANSAHISTLKDSDSEKMISQGVKEMMTLGGLTGDQFDKAYIDAMVKGHQSALTLIDSKLMKTAKSEDIKKFLTDTRAVVIQHLTDAKKLQSNLKS